MNIYIPIEIKVRELESRSLLAFEAASRSHNVLIGHKEGTRRLAIKKVLKPGLLFDKSLVVGQLNMLMSIKNNNHIITCQDEEHGLLYDNYDEFAQKRFHIKTIEHAESIYCWGDMDTNYLKNIFSHKQNKFINTGSPRVDIWRKEFDVIYKKKNNNKYILVISNFGKILNNLRLWEIIEKQKKWCNVSTNFLENIFQQTSFQTELLYKFIEMISELSKNFKNISIIIRSHPNENLEAWKTFVKSFGNNVIINNQGGITKLVRNALVVIHYGCTTGFEAAISGVPLITFNPINNKSEIKISNMLGFEAKTTSQIKMIISELINNKIRPKINENLSLLNLRFSNLTGNFAFKKMVDHWENFDSPRLSESNDEFIKKQIDFYLKRKQNQWNLKNLKNQVIKNIKRIKRKFIPQVSGTLQTTNALKESPNIHKFPFLELQEMQQLREDYSKLCPAFKTVNIYQFGRRAYLLTKKQY